MDKNEELLNEYYDLLRRKYIDSELGRDYDPDRFHGEQHRIRVLLAIARVDDRAIERIKNEAEKAAYNYLKG